MREAGTAPMLLKPKQSAQPLLDHRAVGYPPHQQWLQPAPRRPAGHGHRLRPRRRLGRLSSREKAQRGSHPFAQQRGADLAGRWRPGDTARLLRRGRDCQGSDSAYAAEPFQVHSMSKRNGLLSASGVLSRPEGDGMTEELKVENKLHCNDGLHVSACSGQSQSVAGAAGCPARSRRCDSPGRRSKGGGSAARQRPAHSERAAQAAAR